MSNEQDKNVGRLVGILMGLLVSIVLSILGPARSGHFTIVAVLVSFLCGSILCILICFLIPIKRLTDSLCGKMKLNPEKILGRIISALCSDLIFTPLISFLMIFMNYKRARLANPDVRFGTMFIGNFIVSFPVAFLIILIFTPLLIKLAGFIVKSTSQITDGEENKK